MIISFCGHSDYIAKKDDIQTLLNYLNTIIGNSSVVFMLGEYGNFDRFAYHCCALYKENHANASLLYVTPYLESKTLQSLSSEQRFDDIVYPSLEKIPKRYAILHRNRYMVEQADIIIVYITHTFGGAYKTYQYAMKLKKRIFNLADIYLH